MHGRFIDPAVLRWRGVTAVSLAVPEAGNYIDARANDAPSCLYTIP